MENIPQITTEIIEIDNVVTAKISKLLGETLLKVELILNNSESTIGEIYNTTFSNANGFSRDEHLYKELNIEYRGKGYGQKMFNLWLKHGGLIPNIEHDNTPTGILFLLKNGYELFGYFESKGINNDFFIINNTQKEINFIKSNLTKDFLQKRLDKVYMLKKRDNVKNIAV